MAACGIFMLFKMHWSDIVLYVIKQFETLDEFSVDVEAIQKNTFWRGNNGRKVLAMGTFVSSSDGAIMVNVEDMKSGYVGEVRAELFLQNYRRIIQ